MYSKLSVAFVAALAAGAQAYNGHHQHGSFHKNGTHHFSALSQAALSTGTGSGPGESGDTTLTYTLGSGSSATVITTTIHHTAFETNTAVSSNYSQLETFSIDFDVIDYLCCGLRSNWHWSYHYLTQYHLQHYRRTLPICDY